MNSIKKQWLIISFAGTTEALRAERAILAAGIPGALIPTPRQIHASCGMSWRAELEQQEAIEKILVENNIFIQSMVEIEMQGREWHGKND
jgi:hypothetical protein